ncbi:probable histidine kinase 5 isoform X2 [Zingiber officinale]|uniref:probable histidine kinase 5 isoform X2 n=1 Tax=Zingiber officinale TaxID=94328 RepID=UPI001C4BCE13|nr:probable histidine kinase 5 isoform X2 [Zingiber officinale]
MAKRWVSFADDKQCMGRRRSRNVLLVLTLLCCVSCSMWLFWGSGSWGILEKLGGRDLRYPRKQILFDRFNISKYHLRSLALLISSLEQERFFKCMNKSIDDVKLSSSLLHTLAEINAEVDHNQGQENLIGSDIFFEGRCLMQIGCDGAAKSSLPDNIPEKIMRSSANMDAIFLKFRQQQHYRQHSKGSGKWSKKLLFLGIIFGLSVALWIFVSMNATITERRKETLVNMCDERARMLQDQFNVSMNHVHALAILVSTFHHGKQPSTIDQQIFAEYTARTAFERPLMSGVAYALRVLHEEREQFEKKYGWKIKKMETEDQSLVKDDFNPEKLDPSPVQDEYAPVIFSQETVSHIVSIDMMSGKQDRENILRARANGKGVLTSPFNLLKSNHLGVVLTFAVYNTSLPPNATPEERIRATVGYLGASFDVPSLVDKLLHQLASKQTIVVNLYDTTNVSAPIRMYGPDAAGAGEMYISGVDFGDPIRKHEMHCRFKHKPQLPWSAITMSVGVAVIVLLVGHIFHAALNRIEEVEDDYRIMSELKVQAEAADVAKSQFLATVSHEIRTPMNGVLGMLQMLMDTELDETQQDFAKTAQLSGKALIALINEVLDLAKIESGRLELEAVPFDPRDILDNVLSLFSDQSQAKGIEMAVYVSEQVPEILIGDPGRFRQIITNLVGNSVKFTEKGHIFVSVYHIEEVRNMEDDQCETLSGCQVVDKQKIWDNFTLLKSSTEGDNAINLIVTVEDTGVGIPQDAQSRIFTPFMQADSSTSRTYGGTGIGLSISKCLVDLMEGEIGFVSQSGIGSTFSFTAVFKEASKSSGDIKRHYTDSILSSFQGLRALVADGRCIRARIIKYHLQRLGILVDVVTKQQNAVQTIVDCCSTSGRSHIDMFLVDKDAWGERSGISFPRFLSESLRNGVVMHKELQPKMFLIATSLNPTEVYDLKLAGYVDSMLKPLRLSMIVACLQKALGMSQKRQPTKAKPMTLQSILRGKNILVVDDNLVNQKVAAGTLKKFGAIVTCADSGKEAIRRLQPPHNFDACFMDVQMPEMDGFEATQKVREMENTVNKLIESGDVSPEIYGNSRWHVPILAMTADVIQATHEHCLSKGMDDYVSKPFEEQQLYSAVAHFFESDTIDRIS